MTIPPSTTTEPWHAAFPSPSNPNPPSITAATLLSRLQLQCQQSSAQPTFLLIDLRRTDHEGGTIRTSLNLPAQTLYFSLPTLYMLCKSAGVAEVIFYCGACSGFSSPSTSRIWAMCVSVCIRFVSFCPPLSLFPSRGVPSDTG